MCLFVWVCACVCVCVCACLCVCVLGFWLELALRQERKYLEDYWIYYFATPWNYIFDCLLQVLADQKVRFNPENHMIYKIHPWPKKIINKLLFFVKTRKNKHCCI